MRLIVVKILPFWARLIYVAENCNENRKNFMSQPNLLLLQMENHKLRVGLI